MDHILDSIIENFANGHVETAAQDIVRYGVIVNDFSHDELRSGAWRLTEVELHGKLFVIIKHNGNVDTLRME